MKPPKRPNYSKVVNKAIKLYGAKKMKQAGFVEVNGQTIDLTASGYEDWQIARDIIDQLIEI